MKKRWLSLVMLVCFSIGFVGGCKEKENNGPISGLNIDGSDVVLKVGENTYTADELFAEMLNTEVGAKTAYEKILKMVVESTVPVDANMTASWELLLDSFEEQVESTAISTGVSEKEARESLLAQEGYSSIDEKKEAYLYDVRLSKIQDNYWKEVKNEYYEKYLEERLPYYVKHVLVKTGYTAARGPYSSQISTDDATALYKVYEMLADDRKFAEIMHLLPSEDTGSQADASGYHMDLTTSFVTEFLHGVFAFDSLLNGKTSEVVGITDVANYYKGTAANSYNFNVIYASDIVALGDSASSPSTKNIKIYETEIDETTQEEKEVDTGVTMSTAYGSSSSLLSRTIIFNQTFNNPGISVIAYDLEEENTPKNVKTININGRPMKVLTDEKENIVFVVCAKGNSSDLWIHFLTVNVSPFDEKVKLFYLMDMDKEETIKQMVADKKAALKAAGKTDAQIEDEIETYEEDLKKFKTYVELKGGETISGKNKVIDEIEGYVKTYAKRGITSGAVAGNDQFLTFDMVEYYMEKGDIKITNEQVRSLVENYVASQKALIDYSSMNSIVNGWNEYYDLITLANSDEIESKKIPMECSYTVNGVNAKSDEICKYSYSKGFEIVMNYYDGDSKITVDKQYQSYRIGQDSFTLPVPEKENFEFVGWYTSANTKDDELVTEIDPSRSSANNKTQLFAKWKAIA